MEDKQSNRYDDLIGLSRPVSAGRAHMSRLDRAAQFAPFAALAGYDAAVRETARLTQPRSELDEGSRTELNEKLRRLQELRDGEPEVAVTYFVPDARKDGGAYVRVTGRVKMVDSYTRTLVLTDRTVIPMEEIYDLKGSCFSNME